MHIPRLESRQNSAETVVFYGDATNISNGDINNRRLRRRWKVVEVGRECDSI
jgi:hypothetical protein